MVQWIIPKNQVFTITNRGIVPIIYKVKTCLLTKYIHVILMVKIFFRNFNSFLSQRQFDNFPDKKLRNKSKINPKKAGRSLLCPHNSKTNISRKFSPMAFPGKSWLFLNHRKEAFCNNKKLKNVQPDCLGAAWKSRVAKKKVQIWPNCMVFTLKKT